MTTRASNEADSYSFPEGLQELPQGTIDFHTHIDTAPDFGWDDPVSKLIPLLDEANIARAVVMTYRDASPTDPSALEYMAEAIASAPDRLVGFARLRPRDDVDSVHLLERAVTEFGMSGLKLHPVSTFQHPEGAATVRLASAAAEMSLPILFHCGDENLSTPLAIELLAKKVPTAKIILGHMGGFFHVEEAIRVAERNPNILLETSATPYPDRISEAVRRIGPERVLYGSDAPGAPPRLEVRKILVAGLTPDEQYRVLHGNAHELLGGSK